MGIKEFVKKVNRAGKQAPVSEPFLCNFTEEQMLFLTEESKVYGSKSIVVRRGVALLMEIRKNELEKLKHI